MSRFRATYSGGFHEIVDEGYSLHAAICGVIAMNNNDFSKNKYSLTTAGCWKFEKLVDEPQWKEIEL